MNTRSRAVRSDYASDVDLDSILTAEHAPHKRPEFVAAAAAARDREREAVATGAKTALPPPLAAPHRRALPARLKDLSNWQKPAAAPTNVPDNAQLPPSTPLVKPSTMKGKASLLETVMRRNVARRASASRRPPATEMMPPAVTEEVSNTFTPDDGYHGEELGGSVAGRAPAAPPSPSLAGEKVRRRIAAVRSHFREAAAEKRLPRGLSLGLSEDEEEDDHDDTDRLRKFDLRGEEVTSLPRPTKRQQSPRLATASAARCSLSPPVGDHLASSFFDPFSSPVISSGSFAKVPGPPISSHVPSRAPQGQLYPAGSRYGLEDAHFQEDREGHAGIRQCHDDDENDDDGDSDYTPNNEVDESAEEYEGMGHLPLYEYDCLPDHLQESPDILTGYRVNYNTSQCFRSLFAWHNDSVAIWTLLCSTIFFGYLSVKNFNHAGSGLYDYRSELNFLVEPADRYIIAGYCVLIAGSFLLASLYSLFRPHKNTEVHDWTCLMDFNSYFVWAFAIFFSTIHFAAYCDQNLHDKLLLGTILVTFIGIWIPCTRFYYGEYFSWLQSRYHSIIVLPMMIMAMYSLSTMGHDMAVAIFSDVRIPAFGFGVYLIGNWWYQSRFPESFFPYRFDYFCNSQQLWHWSLTTSAFCVYRALQQFAAVRANTMCKSP